MQSPREKDSRPGASEDRALLENEMGHEDHQGAVQPSEAFDDTTKPIGARRRSEETNVHLDGEGGVETRDGLSESEEATRHAAEDREDREARKVERPVFDRGDTPPKV